MRLVVCAMAVRSKVSAVVNVATQLFQIWMVPIQTAARELLWSVGCTAGRGWSWRHKTASVPCILGPSPLALARFGLDSVQGPNSEMVLCQLRPFMSRLVSCNRHLVASLPELSVSSGVGSHFWVRKGQMVVE
uniref:Uncharacterized protein n=1 Tax=Eutreptiella gymnastica TaxID=73025 RepID=A0A7S1J6Y8_9EUGL